MNDAILLGNTPIQTTDQNAFADGFQAGSSYFNLSYRGKPFTESQLYNFIAEAILDPRRSHAFVAGQVVGLTTALLEQHPRPSGERVFVFRVLIPEGR